MSDPAPFLRYLKTAFVALLLLALSACMQDAVIVSFTASDTTVTANEEVRLSWEVASYDSLTLTPAIGDVSGRSSVTVTPSLTTEYTLTATKGSSEQSRSVTVQVGEPPDISFTAAEITIGEGESTTLSWEVTGGGATSVTLTSDDGLRVDALPKEGSYDTGPLGEDTSYTLTAENAFGSSAAAVHVQVGDGPTVNAFAADPAILPEGGGDVTLSWEVEGEGSLNVEISSDNGPDLGPVEPVGSETVTVTETTTFVLNATDDEGGRTAEVTVEVEVNSGEAPVIGFFEASPETIDEGDSTTLSWNVTGEGGVTVTLMSDKGLELASLPAEGSYTTEPLTEDTTYTLTAENEFGSVSSDPVTVTVISAPPPPPPDHITLLIAGQSNASGRGEMENVEQPIEQVRMLGNDYVWKRAEEPLDSGEDQVDDISYDAAAGHSFGVPLGKELYNATVAAGNPRTVYLIPSSRGASCVSEEICSTANWYPTDDLMDRNTLFGSTNFRAKVSAGEVENPVSGKIDDEGGPVTAIIWYQGESDSYNDVRGDKFIENTNVIMDTFQDELGENLPTIYVQLAVKIEDATYNKEMQNTRERQRRMETAYGSQSREDFYMVVAHDLPMVDEIHVSTEGLKELGRRISLAYQEHVLGWNVDGTGPRLINIERVSANVLKINTTSEKLTLDAENNDYEGYFSVFANGSSTPLSNTEFEVERDDDPSAIRITLDSGDYSSLRVLYGPPFDRALNETMENVVKDAETGLPLPAFGFATDEPGLILERGLPATY